MKKVLNIGLSLFLTVLIALVVFAMTILNKSFVKLSFTIHNYYEVIQNNINNEITMEHSLEIKDIKGDVNNYIDGYYEDRKYGNKIYTTDEVDKDYLDEVYNRNIKAIKSMNNIRMYHDIIDILIMAFIILGGFLFVKTKKIHNLKLVLIISSILGIICSGVLFIFNNFDGALGVIVNDCYSIYLGINLFILLFIAFKSVFSKINLFKKV